MIYLLVFLSGFAGLVYEILWMKQLGLLFGNTSYAAAVTLAAFFGGLAAGSWFWGQRCSKMNNALRVYAYLEVGIAVTALLYFVVLKLFYVIYPFVYQNLGAGFWLLSVKFLLAVGLVFPPALFMGGTIPVVGEYVIKKRTEFGFKAAFLYGLNTLGAGLGALLAGFFFPLWLGFTRTCFLAIGISCFVAAVSFAISRFSAQGPDPKGCAAPESPDEELTLSLSKWASVVICFMSGFGVLALEVLWTRMFAQVLENSVYTFAAILVTVLAALALGALISSVLARRKWAPANVLGLLCLFSGIGIALMPFVFMRITDGFQVVAVRDVWSSYIITVFRYTALTVGIPACLLGVLFPYLMKAEALRVRSAGGTLGRLAAVNTVGAILGSLLCGFVFLRIFGMWRSMQIISVLYLMAAMLISGHRSSRGVMLSVCALVIVILHFNLLNAGRLPVISSDSSRPDEVILETWETSGCTVAAISDPRGRSIKVNSHYGLGATGAVGVQAMQADIPLKIHPDPESVFFLGMGTGITAGTALLPEYNVKKIVTCELVKEVITAAEKYIADFDGEDFTNGLFDDPRSTVLAEDGRHYLMATKEKFDIINSDLFIPYRSGAGSLYTKEHFTNVRDRLKEGGLFFQWLPMYQVTETEFCIVARTMLDVFETVSLWRNNFQPGSEVIAIVGHKDDRALPACGIDSKEAKAEAVAGKTHRDLMDLMLPFDEQTVIFFYCGNISKSRDALFGSYPVNTDDRPVIEYMAPRSFRNKTDVSIPWFIGPPLAVLVDEVQELCPPYKDPLLINRTRANKRLPVAGAAYHWARIWQVIGDSTECSAYWAKFLNSWLTN